MDIIICTHGRGPKRQLTYDNLPPAIQEQSTTLIQWRERENWLGTGRRIMILPDHVRDLPSTREWVHRNMNTKVVMLDDDLVFSRRRTDEPTKFTGEDLDLEDMFKRIENGLDFYAHVGVSHREGANRNTATYLLVGRMMRVLAYRTDIMLREKIISNRTPDVEDFDVTLQLLRKGYPNFIVNNWVHNQGGSDQTGGCSEYRTPETHDRDVRIMAEAHAPFVKVVKKKTKDKWCADENGERTDVIIQWKKAFASAPEVQDVCRP